MPDGHLFSLDKIEKNKAIYRLHETVENTPYAGSNDGNPAKSGMIDAGFMEQRGAISAPISMSEYGLCRMIFLDDDLINVIYT